MSRATEISEIGRFRAERAEEERQQSLADAEFERKQRAQREERNQKIRSEDERRESYLSDLRSRDAVPKGESASEPEPTSPAEAAPDLLKDSPYYLRWSFELLQAALRRSKHAVDLADPKATAIFMSSKLTLESAALLAELWLVGLGHLTTGELVVRSGVSGVVSVVPLRELSRERLILAGADVSPLEPLDAVDAFATDAGSITKRQKIQKFLDAICWMCARIRLPGTPTEFLAEIATDDARRRDAVKAELAARAEAEAALAAAAAAAQSDGDDSGEGDEDDDGIDIAAIVNGK
jgi:hypothetical protein